jgi:hypothetical protein
MLRGRTSGCTLIEDGGRALRTTIGARCVSSCRDGVVAHSLSAAHVKCAKLALAAAAVAADKNKETRQTTAACYLGENGPFESAAARSKRLKVRWSQQAGRLTDCLQPASSQQRGFLASAGRTVHEARVERHGFPRFCAEGGLVRRE